MIGDKISELKHWTVCDKVEVTHHFGMLFRCYIVRVSLSALRMPTPSMAGCTVYHNSLWALCELRTALSIRWGMIRNTESFML